MTRHGLMQSIGPQVRLSVLACPGLALQPMVPISAVMMVHQRRNGQAAGAGALLEFQG